MDWFALLRHRPKMDTAMTQAEQLAGPHDAVVVCDEHCSCSRRERVLAIARALRERQEP